MTSLLHFITGFTVMLLGIILGIIGLSQAFRYILHWLIYSVCPFMNVWCNIWDRGFIRVKVLGFYLITTVCGRMEPQPDVQLGAASVWPQTCDYTLKVQLKYLVSISMDGKLMNWCSVRRRARESYLAAMCAQKPLLLRLCWKALSPQVRHTLDTFHKAPEEINIGSSRL